MKDVLDHEETSIYDLSRAKKVQYFLFLIPLTGIVFRFMHWPFASILIISGTSIAFSYGLSILSSFRIRKPSIFALATFLEIPWMIVLVLGILFNGGIPYNSNGLMVHLGTFVVFFIGFMINHKNSKRRGEN